MSVTKRERGRPRKAISDQATARIEINMTGSQKAEWQELAELSGYKSVTKWVKSLVEANRQHAA